MVIKFDPEGRVDVVFGAGKQEASDEDAASAGDGTEPQPLRCARRLFSDMSDRRRLGRGRQRLYERRLHQFGA